MLIRQYSFEELNTIHFVQNVRVEVEKINGQKLLLDYHQKILINDQLDKMETP
jgi:hypothetical protein